MNFLELAQNRYTTKKYDATYKIPENKIQELEQILRLSPSSIDSQPWKFFFISDADLKTTLSKASYFNEHKVVDASHVVVFAVLNDVEKFEEQISKALPEGAVAYFRANIKPLPETEIKTWMTHQVYLSLGFFLSAAASMGIDSTPMEGINTAEYGKILNLTEYIPVFAVALGKRTEDDTNQPSITPKSRLALKDVIVNI